MNQTIIFDHNDEVEGEFIKTIIPEAYERRLKLVLYDIQDNFDYAKDLNYRFLTTEEEDIQLYLTAFLPWGKYMSELEPNYEA